jgi:hypothetical protein
VTLILTAKSHKEYTYISVIGNISLLPALSNKLDRVQDKLSVLCYNIFFKNRNSHCRNYTYVLDNVKTAHFIS